MTWRWRPIRSRENYSSYMEGIERSSWAMKTETRGVCWRGFVSSRYINRAPPEGRVLDLSFTLWALKEQRVCFLSSAVWFRRDSPLQSTNTVRQLESRHCGKWNVWLWWHSLCLLMYSIALAATGHVWLSIWITFSWIQLVYVRFASAFKLTKFVNWTVR